MVKVRPYNKRGVKGWEVDISARLPSGRLIRERRKAPVTSRSAAQRWGDERLRHLLTSQATPAPVDAPQKPEVPTFASLFPRWLEECVIAEQRKASTVEGYRRVYRLHLESRLGARPVDSFSFTDVQQLKAVLRDRKPNTVNIALHVFGAVLRAAARWRIIRGDQLPEIKLLKTSQGRPRFYDFERFEGLVRLAAKIDPRLHLLVLLGGDAGLRRGEIAALEWTDLDLARGLLTVSRQQWDGPEGPVVDTPKSGRSRAVPLTPRLSEALSAHRHLRGPRVLYRDDGRATNAITLASWLAHAQRRAGLRVEGVHVLRHTFGSHLAMRGVPVRTIQELMGHRDLKETLAYMHLAEGSASEAIRRLRGDSPETGDRVGKNTSKIEA